MLNKINVGYTHYLSLKKKTNKQNCAGTLFTSGVG